MRAIGILEECAYLHADSPEPPFCLRSLRPVMSNNHTCGPLKTNKAELEASVAPENKQQTATGVRAYGTPLANANVRKKAELTLKTFLMQDVTLDAVVLIRQSSETPRKRPMHPTQ